MKYIKTEFRKLTSMGMVLLGSFLILEHIYTYGGLDIWDILGHEWLGLLLIIGGFLLANRKWKLTKEMIEEGKNKIKYVFGRDK